MSVKRTRVSRRDSACALLVAFAGVWHTYLITKATNDNFLHLTLAQQLLAGDWPVRDFFDHGWVLQYTLSALAQVLCGQRLLAEGVIVGAGWAISTYLVYALVARLTASRTAAALSAVLLIVAGARGYSYPKGIVYAVAAVLWWGYVRNPTTAKIAGFGAWAAAAFYWRADHGVLVAAGIVLAAFAAHGPRPATVIRPVIGGATMLLLVAPYLVYVQLMIGLPHYIQAGALQAEEEHASHGKHEWPVLRLGGEIVRAAPAEDYAPTMTVRWSATSSTEERRQILARYGLVAIEAEEPDVERVRLSEASIPKIRALLNEPIVADTAGVDRSTATFAPSAWTAWDRWSFRYRWLRLRLLPSLDAHARASELTVALFYVLPVLAVFVAPRLARHLSPEVSPGRLIGFAVFAFAVDFAMLRSPFPARAPDAVVLSAILFGCFVGALWRAGDPGSARHVVARAIAVALAAAVMVSVAGAGQFGERISALAGGWRSLRSARAAWRDAYGEVIASPPLTYFEGRRANVTLRLSAYVRECVPDNDRLLVLWFAPDIYYHSDRLMASRHLVFVPRWASFEPEQAMALEKVRHFAPPLVLTRRSALDEYARASYPGTFEYVDRNYVLAATIHEEGEEYQVLARRDRPPARRFGEQLWPCYSNRPSEWSRVGREGN